MAWTVWNTSITPSAFRRSIIMLIPQNTPVRPTPPLQRHYELVNWKTPQPWGIAVVTLKCSRTNLLGFESWCLKQGCQEPWIFPEPSELFKKVLKFSRFNLEVCNHRIWRDGIAHLQCRTIAVLPLCCCHFCTWPMRSTIPTPESGSPVSGQSVYWNWHTVRESFSCNVTFVKLCIIESEWHILIRNGKKVEWLEHEQTNTQTRQTDRQIERQTDRQTKGQTNRYTNSLLRNNNVDQMQQKNQVGSLKKSISMYAVHACAFFYDTDIPRCVWAWISWKCNRQTTLPLLAQQEWHHTSEIPRKASNDGTSPDNKQIVHELHSYHELLERKRKHNIYPKYSIVAWF